MPSHQLIGILFALAGVASCLAMLIESRRSKTVDPSYNLKSLILLWVSRLMVGFLFLYSGFVKANDFIGFGYKLEEYFLVFGTNLPALRGFFDLFVPISEQMAWGIAVFEVVLAVAILLGWRMNLTMWLTLLMMVFFTFLTGYSSITGAVTDCGCFGDALKIEPWESFVKDLILMLLIAPLFLARKYISPFPNARVAGILTLATFLITSAYSYYCYENLPVVDYRAYKVGVDLRHCTTFPEDIPKCKDWDPFFEGEEVDLFEGKILLVVVYDMDRAPDQALKDFVALSQALQGSDIRVVLTTATGPSQMPAYSSKYGITVPIAYMDQTVLKTIIRSHPGYVLVEDAMILGKWHYHNIPSVEELRGN